MNWNKIKKAKWFIPVIVVVLVLAAVGGVFAFTTFNSCTVKTTGTTIVVQPNVLTSIQVLPNPGTAEVGGATQAFTATATFSDGTTGHAVSVTWSSSDPTVATIDPSSGIATAVKTGTTTITATSGSITGIAALNVTDTCDWSIGGVTVLGTSTIVTVNFPAPSGTVYAGDPFTVNAVSPTVIGLLVKNTGSTLINGNNWIVGAISGIPSGLTGVAITATSPSITTGNTATVTITLTATGSTGGTTVSLSGMSFTLTPHS